MKRHRLPRPSTVVLLGAVLGWTCAVGTVPGGRTGLQRPAISEKASRTPAQKKIDARLLFEIYRLRGEAAAKGVPPANTGTKIDESKRALVDVRGDATLELQKKVMSLGGTIVSTSTEYRSIVAWIPLLKLELLADERDVTAIAALAEATAPR